MGGTREGGAGHFSDAGYANRASTGYRAGPHTGPSMDSRARNPRYSGYSVATRPATAGNLATALAGALPGGGLIQGAIGLAKGTPGDPYSGPVGKTTGYSYDGRDQTPLGVGRRQRKTVLGA